MKKTFHSPLFPPVELSFYDGFPYLVTRVVPNLNHHLLLPAEASRDQLIRVALGQVYWNRLDSAVVFAPDEAIYVYSDLSLHDTDQVPTGGIPITGKLAAGWSLLPSSETAARQAHLVEYLEERAVSGFLVCDGSMEGREASGADLERLGRRPSDALPPGLELCSSCLEYRGECLHQNPRFKGLVIHVRCSCENWNRCAGCGGHLSHRRLNAPRVHDDGKILFHPGFSGLGHVCEGRVGGAGLHRGAP